MRLIDADTFKKQIAGMTIANNYPVNKASALCDLIYAQPTAYAPDKVVEELDKLADKANDKILEAGELQLYYDGYEDAMRTAVEIVKGGGVDG